jgi:hypothetical protein
MRKKKLILELETIAKHNDHVESLLRLYKDGYKPIDEVMLEMVAIMAFDSYALREALNRANAKVNEIKKSD